MEQFKHRNTDNLLFWLQYELHVVYCVASYNYRSLLMSWRNIIFTFFSNLRLKLI